MAGVVLAAGRGERLWPLTTLRPKPLCPVGDALLVDHALARFDGVTTSLAVNVHHHRDQMESHLFGRVHLSVEADAPLGTAGALGHLRDWVAGRPCLVANGDTWCTQSLSVLVDGWDGERIRILSTVAGPLGRATTVAGALMPWADVAALEPAASGLYEVCWAAAAEAGRVEVVGLPEGSCFVDCGTPADYLRANLTWSDGATVVGAGAVVDGTAERSVLWPGAVVRPVEQLVQAIRAHERMTVLVR